MIGKLVLAGTAFVAAAFMVNVAPASAQNHYACYQIKAKADKVDGVTLSNVVEASGTAGKCKLKFICVPTDKNANTITGTPDNLECWQCKGGKPAVSFTGTDQFAGNVAITTKKLKLVCNPSTLTM